MKKPIRDLSAIDTETLTTRIGEVIETLDELYGDINYHESEAARLLKERDELEAEISTVKKELEKRSG